MARFYHWEAKYGGLEVNEALRLRQLEDERTAELDRGAAAGPRCVEGGGVKKVLSPLARREADA